MLRHHLLPARVLGMALLSGFLLAGSGLGQEEVEGRATLGPRVPRDRLQRELPEQQTQAVERPVDNAVVIQLPAELESLLLTWEQRSSDIEKLRGTFMRYVYDEVYGTEKRARGMFWYQAPDHGRMDFEPPVDLPDPPINEDRISSSGEPFRIQAEEKQKWICTGEEIYIIHEDLRLYDYIEIPPDLQGHNISEGPLPFLFGMRAEEAKRRYHLNLGEQNWPQGRIIERDGQQFRLRPQVHVVAYPKTETDSREWSRAEVLLDGESFLPRAIRLLDPSMKRETVYVFDPATIRPNEVLPWIPNPFNERPPRNFNRFVDQRANGGPEQPANGGPAQRIDPGIVPAGAQGAQP